jgi:hypothetical protein
MNIFSVLKEGELKLDDDEGVRRLAVSETKRYTVTQTTAGPSAPPPPRPPLSPWNRCQWMKIDGQHLAGDIQAADPT